MKKLGTFISLVGIVGLLFAVNKVPIDTKKESIIFKLFDLPIKANHLVGVSIFMVLIGISIYCKKTKRRSYPY